MDFMDFAGTLDAVKLFDYAGETCVNMYLTPKEHENKHYKIEFNTKGDSMTRVNELVRSLSLNTKDALLVHEDSLTGNYHKFVFKEGDDAYDRSKMLISSVDYSMASLIPSYHIMPRPGRLEYKMETENVSFHEVGYDNDGLDKMVVPSDQFMVLMNDFSIPINKKTVANLSMDLSSGEVDMISADPINHKVTEDKSRAPKGRSVVQFMDSLRASSHTSLTDMTVFDIKGNDVIRRSIHRHFMFDIPKALDEDLLRKDPVADALCEMSRFYVEPAYQKESIPYHIFLDNLKNDSVKLAMPKMSDAKLDAAFGRMAESMNDRQTIEKGMGL